MSWTDELLAVYNYNCTREFENGEPPMLPLFHIYKKVWAEITIDENGVFLGARTVEKSDADTVIPATEDSAARTSGICTMPYADKLEYIAGDYEKYVEIKDSKESKNETPFQKYKEQLRQWKESDYSHPAVDALYAYLSKGNLMEDLIKASILKNSQKKVKLAGGEEKSQGKVKLTYEEGKHLVRVIVVIDGKSIHTWEDKSLQECFIRYNRSLMGKKELCYASGEVVPVTYKHPNGIRFDGDLSKLFSANDKEGFTYRGRFYDEEQAVAIGYEFSQKIHIALIWLMKKQGIPFGSFKFVTWASALQSIPSVSEKLFDDEEFADEIEAPSTAPMYTAMLKRRIFGYKEKLQINTKVMLLGIDTSNDQNKGRLNISMYSELDGSQFLDNIERWHSQTAWRRYKPKDKRVYDSFSLYEIANCAFGAEIDCDNKYKYLKNVILRLIPCVIQRRRIPADIVNALYCKASNPQSYDNSNNHRLVLEVACGMIRKSIIENTHIEQEDYLMAYDPNITDRSYLFGCLLAIADKAEGEAFGKEERGDRQTNAR